MKPGSKEECNAFGGIELPRFLNYICPMETYTIIPQTRGSVSAQDEDRLVSGLNHLRVRVVDRIPGMFLIEAEPQDLEKFAEDHPLWKLSLASRVELDPRFRPLRAR